METDNRNIYSKKLDENRMQCYTGCIKIDFEAGTKREADYMLKMLDEKVLRSDDEMEDLYKDCKYLYIIDSYDKIVDHNGYLYCVSTSNDSFDQLIDQREKLRAEGKLCVLGGSYNNGGAVGVQYEYKEQ